MWYISQKETWLPVYLIFAWWLWDTKGGKALIATIISIALLITLSDQSSVHFFKEVFMRYRPTHNLEIGDQVMTVINPDGQEYRGGKYGFVSSHAANNFGVAMLLFLILRPMWWVWGFLLFLWAGVISYSRIYLGVHYPADIVCGALLGCFWAILVFLIYRAVGKKMNYL